MDYKEQIRRAKNAAEQWRAKHPIVGVGELLVDDMVNDLCYSITDLLARTEAAEARVRDLEAIHRTEMCEDGYDCVELGKVRKALQAAESKLDEAKRYDWISVKDKMPERSEHVIWAFKDGTIGILPSWAIVGGVIHWMPLPELPEQEE